MVNKYADNDNNKTARSDKTMVTQSKLSNASKQCIMLRRKNSCNTNWANIKHSVKMYSHNNKCIIEKIEKRLFGNHIFCVTMAL